MRYARQSKILEIIKNEDIDTQEGLAERLRAAGFQVTQATVSRDIRELKLVKVAGSSGKSVYAQGSMPGSDADERYIKILRETVISVKSAGNLIVVKTLAGCANAAAEAIDKVGFSEIIGSIAGDNNIFLVIESEDRVPSVMERFEKLKA